MKRRANFGLLFGLVLGLTLVVFAVQHEIGNQSAAVFVHPVALAIVVGGCIAAALISRPLREIGSILRQSYYAIMVPKNDFLPTALEILRICRNAQADLLFLDEPAAATRNKLIADAITTLNLGFPADEVRKHLERRRDDNEADLQEASDFFSSLSKLGPAFGLLGTLVGLIVLLYYHMGSGEMTKVASSMGIALTATLYGVTLSNLVFGPLAEYMAHMANQSARLDGLIVEGAVLLRERRHPLYVIQALRASLPKDCMAEFEDGARALMNAKPEDETGGVAA